MEKSVKNIIVALFTGLNSFVLPFIAKQYYKMHEGAIEKSEFLKRLGIIAIIFLFCVWFECGYMKDIQQGILEIYKNGQLKTGTQ